LWITDYLFFPFFSFPSYFIFLSGSLYPNEPLSLVLSVSLSPLPRSMRRRGVERGGAMRPRWGGWWSAGSHPSVAARCEACGGRAHGGLMLGAGHGGDGCYGRCDGGLLRHDAASEHMRWRRASPRARSTTPRHHSLASFSSLSENTIKVEAAATVGKAAPPS
jgi:hypothetical protein